MKVTKQQLQQLIKEELQSFLNETHPTINPEEVPEGEVSQDNYMELLNAVQRLYMEWKPTEDEGTRYKEQLGDVLSRRGVPTGMLGDV